MKPLRIIINESFDTYINTLEDAVIEFFGSREEAEAQAHLWILEEKPLSGSLSDLSDGAEFRYEIVYEYRIRRKTEEELEEDREAKVLQSSQEIHGL